MKSLRSLLIVTSVPLLILLGACGNENQAASPDNNTNTKATEAASKPTEVAKTESSSHAAKPQKGGQVVESGKYHLEFVPEKEDNGTHLDFYLQKGDNHEAVPNAKVTAQIQLPDGTQKTLPLTYDAEGKHYAALLPGKASGQYQVKISSEINGEKVDGRFNFNK
jgi:hypothetical protein